MKDLLSACCLAILAAPCWGQEPHCTDGDARSFTETFYFESSAAEARSGEVIRVDFRLVLDELNPFVTGLSIVGCYEDDSAELLTDLRLGESFAAISPPPLFFELGGDVGPQRPGGGPGFYFSSRAHAEDLQRVLEPGEPISIGSMYFRVFGEVGDRIAIRFCEAEFAHITGSCMRSTLRLVDDDVNSTEHMSTRHRSATIRIVEGEPRQVEVPPMPPAARVYEEAPTPETANIQYELRDAVGRPGEERVAMELFATSDLEWSGYSMALRYDGGFLRVVDAVSHLRGASLRFDDTNGWLGLVAAGGTRRLGREGERVHVATLYFDVTEEASVADAARVEFGATPFHINWLQIRHEGGIGLAAEAEPVSLEGGQVKIQTRPTVGGDVNFDRQLDLSDAVDILNTLFQGSRGMVCAGAGDFNGDESINITDAIGILTHLFQGGDGPARSEVYCSEG